MKNKFFRRAAVLTAALFSFTCMSATAYAQSNEPVAETELPAAEETTTKPFTPDGTGAVVDNATDEDGKEFFTITTPSENVFYLVIDRQRTENNVYFLNAVTEKDLLALAEADPEPEVTEPVVQPEPDPEPVHEPEPEPEKDTAFPVGNLLMVAAVALVGGGAAYYFKVYRPKHEAAGLDEDDYDYEDDDEELDDEELYEVTCPSCGDTICVTEDMLDEGSVNCPNCGELLEFDFDDECDCGDDDCGCGCGHDHDHE